MVKQTVETPVIWDAIMLIMTSRNVTLLSPQAGNPPPLWYLPSFQNYQKHYLPTADHIWEDGLTYSEFKFKIVYYLW